jgi:hypothetical protein
MTACQSSSIQTATTCGSIRGMRDVAALSDMLRPCDARRMRRYPVSARINSVANDDQACFAPVELPQTQNHLFL